jgi:hypothetical protein
MDCHSPEFGLRPLLSLDTSSIQLWHGQRDLVAYILVKHTHQTDRQGSECKIDQQNIGIVVEVSDIEVRVDLIPEQSESPDDVLATCQNLSF